MNIVVLPCKKVKAESLMLIQEVLLLKESLASKTFSREKEFTHFILIMRLSS